jgi:tetratricopeptide (TPR) repeat protein
MEQEQKVLEETIAEFTKGVGAFNKRDYKQASDSFDKIIDNDKLDGLYKAQTIQARARVYKNICQSNIKPVEIPLEDNQDYLYDGIYNLNRGNLDAAAERFQYLEDKKYDNPYLHYLMGLLYLKKNNEGKCITHLKAAIEKDKVYRIIAHNEPDFGPLFENEEFVNLLSLAHEE